MPRLVLFPHGPPADPEPQRRCMGLVVRCGGDVRRVIDGPATSLEAFVRHVARSRVMQARERALVVLTRTNPVALKIVQARRTLEAAFPILEKAAWLVFLDEDDDPFFARTARDLGTFDDPSLPVPIWKGPDEKRFLVVTRTVDDDAVVAQRLADLEYTVDLASSAVVRKADTPLAEPQQDQELVETVRPPKIG